MPRTTREWAKRKLDEAVNNLDWSGHHLQEVVDIYKTAHPEISGPLEDVQKLLIILQEGVKGVRGKF